MRHTLVARVRDEPGVLNRVSSLFRRRAFNIESLTVGQSEMKDFSRMTVVVDTARVPARLVEESLRKLIPVAEVTDVTDLPTVDRDLALIRVRCAATDRAEIAQLAEIFRGRIVDVAPDSVIVEVTGDGAKVDGLVDLLRPRGILEIVRTGKIAMLRGVTPTGESKI
jgi:acetolactate synthase I/III small subunit